MRLKISVIIVLWAQHTFLHILLHICFPMGSVLWEMCSSGGLRGKSTIVKYITDMIRENNNSIYPTFSDHLRPKGIIWHIY